ncbi:hypothetical protein R2531_000667 [Klebsiella oxytoca]
MLTIFSHNHFFKKAMRLKINDIKAVRKANLVDLCLTRYSSSSHAQFHFLINSFEMKKNFVCFKVEGNIICLINKRRTAHIASIIARVTDGIPVGEDITLTEREFQYIFIMKFNVLAKDYPELLGISPKFVYPANDLHKAQLLTQLITSHGGIGSGKIIIALLPL